MAQSSALHDRLVALVEPELALLATELVELELLRGGGRLTLRFAVDRVDATEDPSTHVGVEECARASRAIARVIEAEDEASGFMPGRFTIEVTSPGIFRRLRTPAHFRRFEGRMAKLHVADRSPAELRGTLAGVDEDSVEVVDAKGQTVRVPLAAIQKAHLDPDLDFGRR